jgi:putative pyoverdin transport system ATP-binding/permease protein
MHIYKFLINSARNIEYSRSLLGVVVLAGLVSGVCNASLLILIGIAISNPGSASTGMVWGFAALCFTLPLCGFVSSVVSNRVGAAISLDLRKQYCRRILATPLRPLEEIGNSRIIATLLQDIPTIVRALLIIPSLGMQIALVLGCLAYLAWLSWSLLLGLLVFIVVGSTSYQIITRKAHRYFDAVRKEWDVLFAHFDALTRGSKELKQHRRRRDAFLARELEATIWKIRNQEQTGTVLSAAASSWGSVLSFVAVGVLLFAVPHFNTLEARTLTGYTLTILYMLGPINGILNTFPIMSNARISVSNIEALGLSLDNSFIEPDSTVESDSELYINSLELRGVTHLYHVDREDRNFTLGPINDTFQGGELIFIGGGNGSGKTTLAKLLAGLYVPHSGEISLNGEVITSENRDFYRQHFSTIFTDFYLFKKFLGLENGDLDKKAKDHLLTLQLDHKVQVEDGILSTIDLSQGQRKRLALLTAYLEDRAVYIFDEWAADQDPVFTRTFYLELLPELKRRGKLTIVITHDDRYYYVADRVIKLEYGTIVSNKAESPIAIGTYVGV